MAHEPIPLNFPPGLFETSTKAGMAGKWHDGHLIRWVEGRLRPVLGWERVGFTGATQIQSPIRALHFWVDNLGAERLGILCERHLYVYSGNTLTDISPVPPLGGPDAVQTVGGYGTDAYDTGIYDAPRTLRTDRLHIGHIWKLANWGEDLLAMTSADGRLLRWKPSTPGTPATAVPNSPTYSRTFVVTPERHVMLFGMDVPLFPNAHARFGWCSQENIEDWNFGSTTNTAGYYDIQPASRILAAEQVRGAVIFWTVQGAFVVSYRGLPYIYTYDHLGAFLGPLSGDAAAVFPGGVIWPAADGFWHFDGNTIKQVKCTVLDWFQQTYDFAMTRTFMTGFFNGNASELWWSFPSQLWVTDETGQRVKGPPNQQNDMTIIFNFEEGWWSKAQIGRTAGSPGTMVYYPYMANGKLLYRHEKGNLYDAADILLDPHQDPPDPDRRNLPWVRSGAVNIATGKQMATTKQIWVDTDAPVDAVGYELFSIKGRYSQEPRSKGLKIPRVPGKIDYRLTGRDFFIKLQSMRDGVTWTHGQSHLLMAPRGRSGFDDKAGAPRAPTGAP